MTFRGAARDNGLVPRAGASLIALAAMAVAMGGTAVAAPRRAAAVDRARLRDTLMVRSGKAPLATGLTIPERGSVEGRKLTRQYLTAALSALGYAVETHDYRTDYTGGTPLFDEATGTRIDKYDYILRNHPNLLESLPPGLRSYRPVPESKPAPAPEVPKDRD